MDILFGSDNQAGVSPEIFTAMLDCDRGVAVAYGDDAWSSRLDRAFSDLFEHEAFVFPVVTGTAANSLGLAAITPGYGETLCYEAAHILTTEAGAPEFYAGGSRLFGVAGAGGKIGEGELEAVLKAHTAPSRHRRACSSLSVTQSTDVGTLYSLDELAALSSLAHGHGLKVHMDGARFANAVVALDTTPAEMTWRAGVDVLSLGTTKNGTMNAEAVVVFDAALARDLAHRQKRAGLIASKMRYVSAQLLAMFQDDLWIRNARQANSVAKAVAGIIEQVSGAEFLFPVETNQIFLRLPPEALAQLERSGIGFRKWPYIGADVYRLVTSFQDGEEKIARVAAGFGVGL